MHLVADHLGTIAADSYTPATASGEPDRKVDTRTGLRAARQAPPVGSARCFAVSWCCRVTQRSINLTPVQCDQRRGYGLNSISSDVTSGNPPSASNANYRPSAASIPNVAVAQIGS